MMRSTRTNEHRRTLAAQREAVVSGRAHSEGYRDGVRATEERLGAKAETFKRMELAERALRDYAQAIDAMSRALQAILGVL